MTEDRDITREEEEEGLQVAATTSWINRPARSKLLQLLDQNS